MNYTMYRGHRNIYYGLLERYPPGENGTIQLVTHRPGDLGRQTSASCGSRSSLIF